MKNVSIFQLVLIAVFVVAAIGGLILFARYKGSSSGANVPVAEIWGVIPTAQFSAIKTVFEKDPAFKINYTEKTPTAFYGDLIEALAAGNGPDLIIIPENLLLKLNSKIFEISFESMSERNFRDTYLDMGNLF